MRSAKKEILEQDRAFVEEYLSNGFDRTAAMLKINPRVTNNGSAREMAYRILKKAEVKKYIDDRLAETILSTNQVLAGISELAETAELQRDRLKGYELLGKHLKLFTEKSEININVGELTDDQLAALARG